MIKAVLFDVGSTLLEADPEIDDMFYQVCRRRGHELDHNEVKQHLPTINEFYETEYLKDGDFWCSPQGSVEIFLDMYRYLSHLMGVEHDCEGIAHDINEAYLKREAWRVYEDVIPCLRELKKQTVALGVVSNWSPNLSSLLRDLSLLPYFDVVTSSAEVGYRKPNRVIFDLTLELMGFKAHEVVHVGDRIDADGVGAKAAGITPIIIDRHQKLTSDCGYLHTDSLQKIPSMLMEL